MRYNTIKFALAAIACLGVVSFAAIPEMRITTKNNQEPTAQVSNMICVSCPYVNITEFKLTDPNNSRNNLTLTDSNVIRVRGNSTAGADKKPYRIKFDKKQGLFGKEKAKSWVLLANYYDPTFTMNAIAFRLGQKMGLEFTNSTSQFVNLYINNNYKGIYQLTEQIQVNPGRVDIDPDKGFLIEFDYHDPGSDDVKFTAAQYSLGTFVKSPEIESNFNINNTKISWVRDEVNALMNKMAESGFPTSGYRNVLDIESFAKYVLIQQFMDNFDFNSKTQDGALPGSNYAYKDVNKKIKAGPLWDFDLSAGVKAPGGMGGWPIGGGGGCDFPTHFCITDEPIKPKHTFYQRLWADPEFLSEFKRVWDAHKSDFTAIPTLIDSIAKALRDNVANNKYAASMMGSGTLTTSTYDTQVSNMKTWWNGRMTFFTAEVNKLNIPSNPNPNPDPTYTLQVTRSAGGNVAVKIGSGSSQNNPSGQLTANANTSITITATANSGYTFDKWTGAPAGINATSSTITFNINSNVNIKAEFTQNNNNPNPPADNYTLQVSRNETHRGDVSVTFNNTTQNNPPNSLSIPAGTRVTITATPSGGRTFLKWTGAPASVNATSPTITFSINENVNIMANFQSISGGGTYTLNVSSNPTEGGSINGQPSNPIAGGESVTLTATANDGYAFREWTATSGTLPTGFEKNNATVTFTINANLSIAANFRENTGGGNRTETVAIVEAEDYASNYGPNMVTSTNNGITNIGYIENGYSATYEVNIARQGQYTMMFRIASNGQSTFRVTVNGVPMGTVSGNTQDWDGYTDAPLSYPDVPLDAGKNIIRLDFETPVNVDYFTIFGDAQTTRYNAPKPAAMPAVTLRSSPRGFTAVLPVTHGYTTYRLIDMRGREIRSGKISQGTTELRFDGLNRSVMLLKLEGKGNPLVLKAVAY